MFSARIFAQVFSFFFLALSPVAFAEAPSQQPPSARPPVSSAKMAEIISVKDFGALGNGIANDTSKIQAAITAACATGTGRARHRAVVALPAGFYKISGSSPLSVPCSLVAIRGAGTLQTVIETDSASATIINIEGAPSRFLGGIELSGFRVQRSLAPAPNSIGIQIKYANVVNIDNVQSVDSNLPFYQLYSNTIRYNHAIATRMANWSGRPSDVFNGFTIIAGSKDEGLGAFSTIFTDCWSLGADGVEDALYGAGNPSAHSKGWDVSGADLRDITWLRTQVAGTEYGYFLDGTATAGNNNFDISFIDAISDNIGVAGYAFTNLYGYSTISINGGWANTAATGSNNYGISLVGTQNISVTNFRFFGAANLPHSRGMYVSSTATAQAKGISVNSSIFTALNVAIEVDFNTTPVAGVVITSNIFNAYVDGGATAISLNGSIGTTIIGNVAHSDPTKWAVWIAAKNTPDNVYIGGNISPSHYVKTEISGSFGANFTIIRTDGPSVFSNGVMAAKAKP